MTTADFAGFRRVPMILNGYSPMKEAETLMKELGFLKVEYNCVYEGPVERLIAGLRKLGWENDTERAGSNPFLLIHPQCYMTFNYAESMTKQSERFIAYFRG